MSDERVRRGMRRQLETWRATLAGGAARVGWKIGLNDPRVQKHLGFDTCVVGHLTLATTLVPGAPHSLAGATRPGAEAEIAVHLAAPLGANASRDEVRGAIEGFGAAIELVDLDRPLDDLEAIVATNVFHRAVLFAPTRPGKTLDPFTARAVLNGTTVATVEASAASPDVIEAIRIVADTLAAHGERLEPGDRIITGSLTPPLWVSAGDQLEVDLGPLGQLALSLTA